MIKFTILLICFFPQYVLAFGVDLHAHLFMDEGVNIIYSGNFFDSKIHASKWSHANKSQVNESILKNSELSIVVASLYAAPILAGESVYQSILKQIEDAETFVKRNPKWIIAKSSTEARLALSRGKKVLILSIEGGEKSVNTLEQIKTLYKRGLRIVTLLHLTKDRIGSPAFLSFMSSIFTMPGATLFCFERDRDYVKINCSGLTSHGEAVADMLMDAGIWIDLSHASDKAFQGLLASHYERNLPLLFTHATLRSKLQQERGVSYEALSHYKKLGGMFGLTPSKKLMGKTENCEGTIDAFREHYELLLNYLDSDQVAIGTDTNGMINHIKPRDKNDSCNHERRFTSFDQNGGWWNFSHTLPLWHELAKLVPEIASPDQITNRFLNEWARVEKAARPEKVW